MHHVATDSASSRPIDDLTTVEMAVKPVEKWQIDPDRGGPVVVAAGGWLWLYKPANPTYTGGMVPQKGVTVDCTHWSVGHMVDWAMQRQAETLLIMDGWCADPELLRGDEYLGKYAWHLLSARGPLKGAQSEPAGLFVVSINGKHSLAVYALQASHAWPFLRMLDDVPAVSEARAATVASAWLLAGYTTGCRLRFSPSYTGLQLMRQTLRGRSVEMPPVSPAYRDLILEHRPVPVAWMRPTISGELHGERDCVAVWSYDRNSSYVTSARAVPIGDPIHIRPVTFGKGELPAFGLYRIDAVAPVEYSFRLPGYFRTAPGHYPREVVDVWAWEPQIRAALAAGWSVRAHGGYAWPRAQMPDLLRTWQERLWSARRECAAVGQRPRQIARAAGRIAEAIVKDVGRAAIGRLMQQTGHAAATLDDAEAMGNRITGIGVGHHGLMSGYVEVENEILHDDLARPEWWAAIVANANERLQTAAWQHCGENILGEYVDELVTVEPVEKLCGHPLKAGGWHQKEHGKLIDRAALQNVQTLMRALNA